MFLGGWRGMSSVYVVAEGKGEQAFVRRVIAVHLATMGVWVEAAQVGKPGRKGGVRSWPTTRKDVIRFLKRNKPDRLVYVTTMFDYYRMPANWPGRKETANKPVAERASVVEDALSDDIRKEMGEGFNPNRFIPYVQMHELEALILAEPTELTKEFPGQAKAVQQLVAAIQGQNPEEINDGPDSAPSVRIIEHLPEYKALKGSAAPSVLEEIGLTRLRERCPHFDAWMTKLEQLAGG